MSKLQEAIAWAHATHTPLGTRYSEDDDDWEREYAKTLADEVTRLRQYEQIVEAIAELLVDRQRIAIGRDDEGYWYCGRPCGDLSYKNMSLVGCLQQALAAKKAT
jgi:hypothetical protein